MQKRLEVGQVVNIFGIKGEVKVTPFTDDIRRFDELKKVYVKIKGESKQYQIENVKYHKNMVLLKFKGIDKIEDAIPLEEGTYFIADLIGLEVYTDEGNILGKVEDIYNTGGKDIYVVKDELGKQILLPGIDEVIKEVNLEDSKIIVHLIPGLVN